MKGTLVSVTLLSGTSRAGPSRRARSWTSFGYEGLKSLINNNRGAQSHHPRLLSPRPRPDLELSFQPSHRASPHVHPELPGLDDELHALIVQPQFFGRQLELPGARFAGLQGHAPEPRERTHRSGDARNLVVHVQLRDLGAFTRPGVRDRGGDLERAAWRDGGSAQLEILVLERRVAQPVAKGKEGARRQVGVLGGVLVRGRRPSSVLVIVVDRNLADAAGEGHGELAAGTHVTEHNAREGGAGLDAAGPRLDEPGHGVRRPLHRWRPAIP